MSTAHTTPAPAGFSIDPRWQAVAEETLRRPPISMSAPGVACHLVFRTDTAEADAHQEHVRGLVARLSVGLELDRYDQLIASSEVLVVKWERHTEFCSLSLFSRPGKPPPDLAQWPAFDVPWRAQTPGKLVVAMKIAIELKDQPWVPDGFVPKYANPTRVKSTINGGTATVETSLEPGQDGYMHLLVTVDEEVAAEPLGRVVQRLIEVETYRTLSLYAWPDVQAIGPRLNEIDRGVARLTEQLGEMSEGEDAVFLEKLTALARELERISATTHFRLNASIAYYDLVQRRIEDLREDRIEGEQRLSDLVNRRLSPAVRTYRSILVRQSEMSERVSRTSQLLRSRIDVELAQHNQNLLASMDRRAKQQYRLQLTVEGLSTVAISYYVLGILSYLLGGVTGLTHGFDAKIWVGLLSPLVVVLVYLGLRGWRQGMHKDAEH